LSSVGGPYNVARNSVLGITFDMEDTTLTSIGGDFLANCTAFNQQLIFPNTLQSIGNEALFGCTSFNKELTLPNSLTSIGTYLLYNCNSMVSTIDIGTIPASAFSASDRTLSTTGSTAPMYVTGITIVGTYADDFLTKFPNRTAPYRNLINGSPTPPTPRTLTTTSGTYEITGTNNDFATLLCNRSAATSTIDFSSVGGPSNVAKNTILGVTFDSDDTSLTSISDNFLYYCTSFNQELTLPNSLQTIGRYFLESCTSFNQELIIPSSITSIASAFLYDCTSFNQELIIPSSIASIGNAFLTNCTSFNQELTLPNSLQTIGDYFLESCTSFNQELIIPSSIASIGNAFLYGCTSFNQELIIPSSIASIENGFLTNCISFNQELIIPSSIASIGTFFLYYCTSFNQELIIPSSIASIGRNFLSDCYQMTSTLNISTLSPTIFATSDYTLATIDSTAPMYQTGITIVGTYADDFLTKFPNRTAPYRNLINGGTGE
jgi:hypothetical protein